MHEENKNCSSKNKIDLSFGNKQITRQRTQYNRKYFYILCCLQKNNEISTKKKIKKLEKN